jgi:hypothetical protein
MSKNQDTDDPTCVIKMLDEFRNCNPSLNLPNLIDETAMALGPTRLQFDDSVVSHDSKKLKITDSSVPVDTAEVCAEELGISVLGEFTTVIQLYIANLKLLSLLLVV